MTNEARAKTLYSLKNLVQPQKARFFVMHKNILVFSEFFDKNISKAVVIATSTALRNQPM